LAVFPAHAWVKDFGARTPLPDSFRGAVYNLPPRTTMLPNFATLKPVGYVYTYTLDVPNRLWTEGMPGITDRIEWFAIDYDGDFWIAKAAKYRFRLTSDDGSKLYIDGRLIVDDDGVHPATEMGGSAVLEAGKHHMRVSYFQGPRDALALVLEAAAPGEELHVFDLRDFRPPGKTIATAAPDDEARPHLRRDSMFAGSASLTGYELAAFEALNSWPRPRAFDFRCGAFRFPADPATATIALTIELPAESLAATREPDGKKNRIHLLLLALVRDERGQVVRKASEDFNVELTDERLAALRSHTLTWTRPVDLPPGHYTMQASVVDREGNRASTGECAFFNPERTGIGLSDIALAQRVEPISGAADTADPLQFQGGHVIPELATTLAVDAQPSVYFVVYPDRLRAEKPDIVVQFLLDGKVIAKQASALPEPDASGAIPMTIASIASVAKPGNYELKVTARQGTSTAQASVRYSIPERER
jgi:hypothetical protein